MAEPNNKIAFICHSHMDVMFEILTKILVVMHSLSLCLSFSLCVCISAALSVLSLMPVCISRAETTLGELLHATPNPTANPPIEK